MPLDTTNFAIDVSPAAFHAADGRGRLQILSRRLRSQIMPKHFSWNFGIWWEEYDCGVMGCAGGLCKAAYPDTWEKKEQGPSAEMRQLFSLDEEICMQIFFGRNFDLVYGRELLDSIEERLYSTPGDGQHFGYCTLARVAPQHVADVIDRFLRTGSPLLPA